MSREVANKIKEITAGLVQSMNISDYKVGTVVRIEDDVPIVQLDGSEGPLPKPSVVVPDYLSIYQVALVKKKDEYIEAKFEIIEGDTELAIDKIKLTEIEGLITIDNRLKENDRIYLLEKTGGQRYLVLGRIPG